MFGPAPTTANHIHDDLHLRMRITIGQRRVIDTLFDADIELEAVVSAIAMPAKTRGVWIVGQPVLSVPVYIPVRNTRGEEYGRARNMASIAALEWLANETGRADGGTVAYAVVYRNGDMAMYEAF